MRCRDAETKYRGRMRGGCGWVGDSGEKHSDTTGRAGVVEGEGREREGEGERERERERERDRQGRDRERERERNICQ